MSRTGLSLMGYKLEVCISRAGFNCLTVNVLLGCDLVDKFNLYMTGFRAKTMSLQK